VNVLNLEQVLKLTYVNKKKMITKIINLFSALLGDYDLNGTWTDLDNSGLDISNPRSVNIGSILKYGTFRFEYCVGDDNCKSCSIISVNICEKPTIEIISEKNEYFVGDEIILSASSNSDIIEWVLPNNIVVNKNPLIINAHRKLQGYYTVNSYSICGCSEVKRIFITIVEKPNTGISTTNTIVDCDLNNDDEFEILDN